MELTREQAIENLRIIQDKYTWSSGAIEALDMAIQALTQVPCDDAISRQAVLESIKNLYPDMPVMDIMGARRKWLEKYAPYFECENAVEHLPSIKPQEPKTGHWIEHKHGFWSFVNEKGERDGWMPDYECSLCGSRAWKQATKYCPNCGTKMESEG